MAINQSKLERLKKLAMAAPEAFKATSGKWAYKNTVAGYGDNDTADQLCFFENDSDGGFWVPMEDFVLLDGKKAEFVAAASPETILELIGEIERLKLAYGRLWKGLQHCAFSSLWERKEDWPVAGV